MTRTAAVIGCGLIGGRLEDPRSPRTYSHAKAYRLSGAFDRIVCCDPLLERAQATAARVGGQAYASLDALLAAETLDAASICVPDNEHAAVAERLMTAPRPPRALLMEKPVCADESQLARLAALERGGGGRIIVNHSRRFDPAHRRIAELARSGGLGRLIRGRIDYYGGWRHLGVHAVDYLHFMFGLSCRPAAMAAGAASRFPDDPSLDATLEIGGATVRLEGWDEAHYQIFDWSLLFELGQIRLTDFGRRVEVLRPAVNAEGERELMVDPAFSGAGMVDPIRAAVARLAAFLDGTALGGTALGGTAFGGAETLDDVGLEEAARTMRVLWRGDALWRERQEKPRRR